MLEYNKIRVPDGTANKTLPPDSSSLANPLVCAVAIRYTLIKCRQHYKTFKRLLVHITGEHDGIFFSGQRRKKRYRFNPFLPSCQGN